MSDKILRLFTAIEFSESIREGLLELISSFEDFSLRWTKRENLHLTLKFIGPFPESRLPELREEIEKTLLEIPSFPLKLQRLGVFPNPKRPSAFWVGVDRNETLLQMAKELEEKLEKLDIPREDRPFRAHITLGRMPRRKDWGDPKKLASLLKEISFQDEMTVEKIALFKSSLLPEGPVYEVLQEFSLKI